MLRTGLIAIAFFAVTISPAAYAQVGEAPAEVTDPAVARQLRDRLDAIEARVERLREQVVAQTGPDTEAAEDIESMAGKIHWIMKGAAYHLRMGKPERTRRSIRNANELLDEAEEQIDRRKRLPREWKPSATYLDILQIRVDGVPGVFRSEAIAEIERCRDQLERTRQAYKNGASMSDLEERLEDLDYCVNHSARPAARAAEGRYDFWVETVPVGAFVVGLFAVVFWSSRRQSAVEELDIELEVDLDIWRERFDHGAGRLEELERERPEIFSQALTPREECEELDDETIDAINLAFALREALGARLREAEELYEKGGFFDIESLREAKRRLYSEFIVFDAGDVPPQARIDKPLARRYRARGERAREDFTLLSRSAREA